MKNSAKFKIARTVKKSQKDYKETLKHSQADYKNVRKKLGKI